MPGTFSKSNRPKRPGAYFNFGATPADIVQPSAAGTVCLVITHDWGPYLTPTLLTSFADFKAVFGPSTTTAGYKAVRQAFLGEGLTGRGGAGSVLVYRHGGASAAKAAKTLKQTNDSTDALTLTARYEGSYGNNISVAVEVDADTVRNDLVITVGGVEVERYAHTTTATNTLAATVNAESDWVTATALTNGTALKVVAAAALTSGADGSSTISAANVTSTLAAVETQRFGVLAFEDLAGQTWTSPATPTSLLASIKTWADNLNISGKRFRTVVGGALDESITTANTRSTTLNDSDFVNVGVGGVVDDTLGTLSTSQLAPRIAGILAAVGESRSLTRARLAGCQSRNFPTEANILSAFDAGTVVLSEDSDPNSPVRVEKGLTTYTSNTTDKPYLIYRNPKFVATIHGIEMEVTEWADSNVIGRLQISDVTTTFVVSYVKALLKAREERGVLQPNSTVGVDQDPPPTAEDEFIALVYGVTFGRSLEQVYNTVQIG